MQTKHLYFKQLVLLIGLQVFHAFCDKEIEIELPDVEQKIVVEGRIEQGKTAEVILTKNSAYFAEVDSNTLSEIVITDAQVMVSSGNQTDTLMLMVDLSEFPFIKYRGNTIVGMPGKFYNLQVIHNQDTLTSQTSIPYPVSIDSLSFKPEMPYDTAGFVWYHFSDPDTLGNFYRVFTMSHQRDRYFTRPRQGFLDDLLINGQAIEYPTYRGGTAGAIQDFMNDSTENTDPTPDKAPGYMFYHNETVSVKLCTIDRGHYKFWESLMRAVMTSENPFATPANVESNIVGGLGIWGGYAVSISSFTIDADNNTLKKK